MKWSELLALVGGEPLFESAMLLAGPDSPAEVQRQLTRWVAAGRLVQLRRGLYAPAPPWSKSTMHPFTAAGRLRRPSYVSLQSALAYHGLIPESVFAVTSITTGRPETVKTPLGTFIYKHVRGALFSGYREIRLEERQSAFIALPEKALLDLFYLTPGPITEPFIAEMRLSTSEILDLDLLKAEAERTGSRKLKRAAALAARILQAEREEETVL